jgi:hypothetical protein
VPSLIRIAVTCDIRGDRRNLDLLKSAHGDTTICPPDGRMV